MTCSDGSVPFLITASCLWNSMGSLCWPPAGRCCRGDVGTVWLSLEINGDPEVSRPLFLLRSKKMKNKNTSSEMKKFTWFNLHWEPVTAILRPCASLYWAADCWCLNPCVPAFLFLFPLHTLPSPAFCLCVWVCVYSSLCLWIRWRLCLWEFTDSKGSMKGGDSEPIIFSLMVPRVQGWATTKRLQETSILDKPAPPSLRCHSVGINSQLSGGEWSARCNTHSDTHAVMDTHTHTRTQQ